MKRGRRISVLVLIMGMFLLFGMAQPVSAYTDWVDVSIDYASYHDLDSDTLEDDVKVNLTCKVKPWIRSPQISDYFITLTLPSEMQYIVWITVYGTYRVIHFSLDMIDTATESGWYNVRVDALAYGGPRQYYSSASYDFDPPTAGGKGEPHVILYVLAD